jgi:hypothetical protein
MITKIAVENRISFRTCDDVRAPIREACAQNPDIAGFIHLGHSEEGRPIDAVILGNGKKHISLIAGAHSDEPVGPETLRTFILQGLAQRKQLRDLWKKYCFFIIPHINPDGEARNREWIRQWPDAGAYLRHAFREPPGRDLEFGYPGMRAENRLVSDFLKAHAPFALHLSLHGMGFSEGAMLLIERRWINQTEALRSRFAGYARKTGLRLHDHDRKGEKGFVYIAPGFTTTPEGRAMQAYFRTLGDEETAGKFQLSSMEYLRTLGGNPLCLVTELPLFVLTKQVKPPLTGVPQAYLKFRGKIPEIKAKSLAGNAPDDFLEEFQIRPLALNSAVRFQLFVIQLGLDTIG